MLFAVKVSIDKNMIIILYRNNKRQEKVSRPDFISFFFVCFCLSVYAVFMAAASHLMHFYAYTILIANPDKGKDGR